MQIPRSVLIAIFLVLVVLCLAIALYPNSNYTTTTINKHDHKQTTDKNKKAAQSTTTYLQVCLESEKNETTCYAALIRVLEASYYARLHNMKLFVTSSSSSSWFHNIFQPLCEHQHILDQLILHNNQHQHMYNIVKYDDIITNTGTRSVFHERDKHPEWVKTMKLIPSVQQMIHKEYTNYFTNNNNNTAFPIGLFIHNNKNINIVDDEHFKQYISQLDNVLNTHLLPVHIKSYSCFIVSTHVNAVTISHLLRKQLNNINNAGIPRTIYMLKNHQPIDQICNLYLLSRCQKVFLFGNSTGSLLPSYINPSLQHLQIV